MTCLRGRLQEVFYNDANEETETIELAPNSAGLVLVAAYVLFMKKYYHLHEEYLESLK